MALLNLVDAATPTLLGRDLNLYWDLPHLPALFGLAGGAAGFWRVSGAVAVLLAAIFLLIAGTYRIWREVLSALTDRRIALGVAILLGVALDVSTLMPAEERPLATGLGLDLMRQTVALARGWHAATGGAGPYAAALAVPAPPHSDLAGLKRRDVYLVYLESYGTTVFDTPEFLGALGESLTQFENSLRNAGYTIASNRLVSPTFGGGSWLAHATVASGVRLDDPVLYTLLLDSGRKLLPAYFKDAGWRTIDIMPGIKAPSPKAPVWGFDREVYASELDYHGPAFGWFEIPDQFTLDRATTIRSALGPERPVFTQLVLVSSHIPFSPVPPYLADWDDCGTFASVPATALEEIYRQPDWSRLAPEYLNSLRYDFAALGGWLTGHRARRRARHPARRSPAAGRRRGPAPAALDRPDPRLVARSRPRRAVPRRGLRLRSHSDPGTAPPGHGDVSRPLPGRVRPARLISKCGAVTGRGARRAPRPGERDPRRSRAGHPKIKRQFLFKTNMSARQAVVGATLVAQARLKHRLGARCMASMPYGSVRRS